MMGIEKIETVAQAMTVVENAYTAFYDKMVDDIVEAENLPRETVLMRLEHLADLIKSCYVKGWEDAFGLLRDIDEE